MKNQNNKKLLKKLKKYQDELKEIEKEKNYIKLNAILKFKDIELEISRIKNQVKSMKLKTSNKRVISQNELFELMDNFLIGLSLDTEIYIDEFN